MKSKPCKNCGASIDMPKGRLCRKCWNAYAKALPSRQRYNREKAWKNTQGYQNKAWTTYPKTCEACGTTYEAYNKYSRLCPVCYARQIEFKTASTTHGRYKRITIDGRTRLEHRYLAEQIFGRPLTQREHIHHLDENPVHNETSNLIVLSHINHHRLHQYLEVQQVIEEKQGNPKPWSELVLPLSLQWLQVNKVPHIRLSELKAFKDQLLKQSKIGNRSNQVQSIIEEKIHRHLYPGPVRVIAAIPDGLFRAAA